MSKAFTREDDDAVPVVPVQRRRVPVPDGVPNYITAAGARALRAELEALSRAGAADAADPVRSHELAEHLASAEIVEPPPATSAGGAGEPVRFGSSVEVEDGAGRRVRYRIVGAIEADPKQHAVGWQSPIARALLGARVGDAVVLPAGEVEIVAITS